MNRLLNHLLNFGDEPSASGMGVLLIGDLCVSIWHGLDFPAVR